MHKELMGNLQSRCHPCGTFKIVEVRLRGEVWRQGQVIICPECGAKAEVVVSIKLLDEDVKASG